MPWVLVIAAGLLEVAFAVMLKQSHGFSRFWPSVAACLSGGASFLMLTMALRSLHVGTAYAVWTGLGAAGTVGAGILFLHEPVTTGRVLSVALVLAGIVGLKMNEA